MCPLDLIGPRVAWSASILMAIALLAEPAFNQEPTRTGEALKEASSEGGMWRKGSACGLNAAYIFSLLTQHKPPRYEDLASVIEIGDQGTSLASVARGLNLCGVTCAPVRASPQDLHSGNLPMIVHLDRINGSLAVGHFSVLVDYDESVDTVLLMDGANGIQYELNVDPFRRMWSGYAVALEAKKSLWRAWEVLIGLLLLVFCIPIEGAKR